MELAGEAFVLSEEITDLTGSHADITSRHVHVRTDDLVQLSHKRLAELHYLVVALTADREVRTSLTTAHRQRRERVLECLLEAEELQDRQVH